MRIKTSRVFEDLESTDKRICVFQGSSRASKTYNCLIWWVSKLLQEDNKSSLHRQENTTSVEGFCLERPKRNLNYVWGL